MAVGIQIGHAGRRASAARPWDGAQPIKHGELEAPWECLAPSAIPEKHGHPTPRRMTESDIRETIDAFALATRPLVASSADLAMGSNIMSMTDPQTGLSLRLEVQRQYKQTTWEFDILYGVKCVRPEFACKVYSGTS